MAGLSHSDIATQPLSAVQAMDLGSAHTCALVNNEVICWGLADKGQLGDGTGEWSYWPVKVEGLPPGIKDIATGGNFNCALSDGGAVFCWGDNNAGQLGDGTFQGRLAAVPVAGLASGVIAITVGYAHACALLGSGAVRCWGDNLFGQVGDGSSGNHRTTPVSVAGLGTNVASVTAGDSLSCALYDNGNVACWGSYVGDGTSNNRASPTTVIDLEGPVSALASGGHTCALLQSGDVECWGPGQHGQIGDGDSVYRLSPTHVSGLPAPAVSIAAGSGSTCAALADGTVWCWGLSIAADLDENGVVSQPMPHQVDGFADAVTRVALGGGHACALTSGARMECWGSNLAGQLGDNVDLLHTSPVSVHELPGPVSEISSGSLHTCGLIGGAAYCWGSNEWGQSGFSILQRQSNHPTPVVGLGGGALQIRAGDERSCAVTAQGEVTCWGWGDPDPTVLPALSTNIKAFAFNLSDICAISDAGAVTCGSSTNQQSVAGLDSGVLEIGMGAFHECALLVDGSVKCWGDNYHGQLGDGTTEDRAAPTLVTGLGAPATAISVGGQFTCALLETGAVKCWGVNINGELGVGDFQDRSSPAQVFGLESGVLDLSSAGNSTCAALVGGTIKCWGLKNYGHVGEGMTSNEIPYDVTGFSDKAIAVSAGGFHNCALIEDGSVECWGFNPTGALGLGGRIYGVPGAVLVPDDSVIFRNGFEGG